MGRKLCPHKNRRMKCTVYLLWRNDECGMYVYLYFQSIVNTFCQLYAKVYYLFLLLLLLSSSSLFFCKGKGKGLDTCYSATYITRDQQRFTILEEAADWHEPMVPQRIMWPSIARANGHWTDGAAGRHTVASISHTRPSPRSRSY